MAVTVNEADLQRDLDLYMHTYCNAIAAFARDELDKYAAEAISQFYGAYTPRVYDRTFDLRDNAYHTFYMKNWYYRKQKNSYVGGIQFDSRNMQPYKSASAGTVLNQAISGWHGYAIQTKPEPFQHVVQAMNQMLGYGYIYDQAHAIAQSKSYKVLKDILKI